MVDGEPELVTQLWQQLKSGGKSRHTVQLYIPNTAVLVPWCYMVSVCVKDTSRVCNCMQGMRACTRLKYTGIERGCLLKATGTRSQRSRARMRALDRDAVDS